MTDRPITFSSSMVEALRAGRKSQTRRLATSSYGACRPGDRLWVRETFAPATGSVGRWARLSEADYMLFRDGTVRFREGAPYPVDLNGFYWKATWCPATIMPRWASRWTLIVEQVEKGRLRDIDRAGAIREGLRPMPFPFGPFWSGGSEVGAPHLSPVGALRSGWNRIHSTIGERWEDDPEVIVLTFHFVRANIDD
jgi:hypothetical protein